MNQTIHDCLTEAMDIDELEQLIAAIEQELTLVAKDLREPSPFAQEIINARPYAFLDDAPFEERRTNAIRNRRWADPAEAKDFSLLDEQAIQQVREEAWPSVGNAEELHDALLSAGYVLPQEFDSMAQPAWSRTLTDAGRISLLTQLANPLWVATEQLPRFRAVFPEQLSKLSVPEVLHSETWENADALREIIRGRLECLGPVTAERLAGELALPQSDVDQALLALEVEGFAFQGQFTPVSQAAVVATGKRHRQSGVSAGFCSGFIAIRSISIKRKSSQFHWRCSPNTCSSISSCCRFILMIILWNQVWMVRLGC